MYKKTQHKTRLGPNCKVVLTHNIDVKLGLTNKTMGIVRKILKSPVNGDPDLILVEIPTYTGKTIMKDINGTE